MTTENTLQRTAAQDAYNGHLDAIRAMMKQLEAKLDAHEKRASAHPTNWGFAGDLGYAETKLTELVSFFR